MNLLLVGQLDADERAPWCVELQRALPDDRIALQRDELAADSIEVVLAANPPPGSLAGLPRLRLIQSLWAGVDRLLADSSLPQHVPLARMVDPGLCQAMAQTALWAVLGLHRGFWRYAQQQRQQRWRQWPQRRANEVPVLILGFGAMGQACAATLRAQGYAVSAWSRTPAGPSSSGMPLVPQHAGLAALPAALAQAEVVLNLLPLTPETRGLIDAHFLAQLPRGAALINLARGAHVVDEHLLAALDAQHLSQAVLDVFHTEPLSADHPFWRHPQVTVLPHVAGLTDPRSAARVVAANVAALKAGTALAHRVDRQRGY